MSAPQLTCPMCDAVLRLSSALVPGAHTRCPRCGTPFSLNEPNASPPAVAATSPVQQESAGSAIPRTPARRPAFSPDKRRDPPSRSHRDGDSKSASLTIPLIVGVTGITALGLLVGLFIWATNRGSRPRDSVAQVARPDDSPPRPGPETRLRDAPPRVDSPKSPPESPPAVPLPVGDSALPVEVLKRVKAATLYIKVQGADGTATGSGFFEQSTGLILTNAHVVGMLRAGAPAPRKVEAVLNSGIEGETSLPARVVSVDHEADLALLRVQLSAAQLTTIPMLTMALAKDLLETQPVYVIGFPFGEKVNRSVTISPSAVSSLHHGPDGTLTRVQVNGGMHPGNSGGPVVDSRGNVVGVAVAGIPGTQINFAIPGEAVRSFLEGRLAEIHVATDAVARNGKLIVPVQVLTIDPRKRITRVALDYWTGPEQPPLPSSDRPPTLGPLTSARQTVEVNYDSDRSQGRAELTLEALPARGLQLWVQPVLTHSSGESLWLAGTAYPLAAPIEEKPTVLAARHHIGKDIALLTSTARFRMENRAGKVQSYVQEISGRLSEQTLAVGTEAARVRLTVEKFDVSVNGARVESGRFPTALRRDIGSLALELRVDSKGNLTSKKNDLSRVPLQSREVLQALGEQIQQAFDIVAIPQPGEVKVGQTWQARRELPIDMPDSVQTALMNVTYTYRGLSEHDGRKVAVLELRGTLVGDRGKETLAASMTGRALIDQTTGVVLKATALTDAALTIRYREETFYATGTLDVRLTREMDGK
jgi:S1-C subfamily serine protease